MLFRSLLGTLLLASHGDAFAPRVVAPTASARHSNEALRPAVSVRVGAPASLLTVGLRSRPRRPLAMRPLAMSGAEGSAPREAAIDTSRIATYFGATGAEVLIISAVMFAVQTVGALLPPVGYKILACVFFAAMSLKSRVFAILDASRPEVGSSMPVETKRPAWTPPGPVFPIVWSTIGILRTVSSMLVWEACGRQMLVLPLIAMMTHLAIGDTWNSINNVEQRKGTAVAGVAFVWASVMSVIYLYHQTLPLAGMVLAPSGLWLSIASFLIYSIWRLNGSDPIRPRKETLA